MEAAPASFNYISLTHSIADVNAYGVGGYGLAQRPFFSECQDLILCVRDRVAEPWSMVSTRSRRLPRVAGFSSKRSIV